MRKVINQDQVLSGLRILVTRPKQQAPALTQKLQAHGATVIELPLLELLSPDSWEDFDLAFAELNKYDWLIFASANAVEACVSRLNSLRLSLAPLANIAIAGIGTVTCESLASYGLQAKFCPTSFVAETLVKEFPHYPNLAGTRILWPRTNVGRTYLSEELAKAGAEIKMVPCYKTCLPSCKEATVDLLVKLLSKQQVDVITLTSSQTVKNLASLLKLGFPERQPHQYQELLKEIIIAVIGPETAFSAKQYLGRVNVEPKQYTTSGMVTALVEHVRQTKLTV